MIALFYSTKSCDKSEEHQCSYDLLSKIIAKSYGIDYSQLELKYTENRKPYIDGIPFSISHSNGVCCVAIDVKDKPYNISDVAMLKIDNKNCASIGVDIECISDKLLCKCRKIAEKKFFYNEIELLDSSLSDSEYIDRFSAIWTKKESYGKYTGKGLSDALAFDSTVDCPLDFYQKFVTIDGKRYSLTLCYNS